MEVTSPFHLSATDTSWENQPIVVDGTALTVDGEHFFTSLELKNGAVLTHAEGGSGLKLIISNKVVIAQGTAIDVTAKGNGPGALVQGKAGGSYGGYGRPGNEPGNPNPVFGDYQWPGALGVGGKGIYGDSRGGGMIWIQTPELVLEGGLQADGQNNPDGNTGGGSGGSILADAGSLRGSGWLSDRGRNQGQNSGAGGGGRIAIYYAETNVIPPANINVAGGAGNPGDAGTVYVSGSPVVRWQPFGLLVLPCMALMAWQTLGLNPAILSLSSKIEANGR